MKSRLLTVTVIDDAKIPHITKEPKNNRPILANLGRGLRYCYPSISQKESDLCSINNLLPIQEEVCSQDADIHFKPTALVENEEDNHSFGFRTPGKKGKMLEKAESALKTRSVDNTPKRARTPKTPRTPTTPSTPSQRTSKSIYRTPTSKSSARKSMSRRLSISEVPETPVSFRSKVKQSSARKSMSRRLSISEVPETPVSFRSKVKQRIKKMVYEDESEDEYDDSDADGNYEPTDSDDDDDDDGGDQTDLIQNDTPGKRRSLFKVLSGTPLRTPRRGREPKVDVDMAGSMDEYFVHGSESGPCLTSDHTLNKLQTPRLGPEALKSLLEGVHKDHVKERRELVEDHMTLFPHWVTLLCEGFSIFLCGVGSKKHFLSLFQTHLLADIDHLVINGFFPSLTIKAILSCIIEEIMEVDTSCSSVIDQLALIASYYDDRDDGPLFLVVHNLDGPMLRNERAQSALSQLASFHNVHLIASLDHINSPLIFDGNKYSCYNPLWWDVTTLAPYTEETSYENSLLVQQSGSLLLSSLIHVFKSLTPNAKGIFIILAKHQLDEKDNSTYIGFPFSDLYQRCRESFLVNSDLTLRAQLTEFKDHRLLKTKKGVDGVENLIILLKDATLQEFLDQHEQD